VDSPRAFPGGNVYEKRETKSFTEPPLLHFIARSNSFVADRFTYLGSRKAPTSFGGAEKSRTTGGAKFASGEAESPAASALSCWDAEGR
jgi:hypothetical protein